MAKADSMKTLLEEFTGGMRLAKCRRCGCMRGALQAVAAGLSGLRGKDAVRLRGDVNQWLGEVEPERHT